MSRTLPPAKRAAVPASAGGGSLQHSSSTTFDPGGREATPAELAQAHLKVQEARVRAGLATPEAQAASHEAAQAHVPRMINWLNSMHRAGRLGVVTEMSDKVKPWSTPGETGIYVRPGDTGHATH